MSYQKIRIMMSLLISIVSHKQADLVQRLLGDIEKFFLDPLFEVIVTINIEEKVPFKETDFSFKLTIIRNKVTKGFGANHNAAFKLRNSHFFCIINPDVRLTQDPFPLLIKTAADEKTGVVTPLIRNPAGEVEDSARRLPTPLRLFQRISFASNRDRLEYPRGNEPFSPDWVAGIFMFFSSPVFGAMKGFDEKFRLYFEDVDLCCRLRLAGYNIILDPRIAVVHNARRDSHKNRHYLWWHVRSAIQFFGSDVYWSSRLAELKMKSKKII
jgi:N-acetylglucosaminyl-diphospho-decaprenol L-rhamnosyltransferase